MELHSEEKVSILMSLLGIILALVVFAIVSTLGYMVFTLFDNIRGLGEDKLQELFREIFCPGAAGYAAIYCAESWLKNISLKIVFFGFSALVFVYVGFYIGFVAPIADEIGSSAWGTILALISTLAGIVGAYYYSHEKLQKS